MNGRNPITPSSENWNGLACRLKAASSGIANPETTEPSSLIDWPVQSLTKSRCDQRPPVGLRICRGRAGELGDDSGFVLEERILLCARELPQRADRGEDDRQDRREAADRAHEERRAQPGDCRDRAAGERAERHRPPDE